MQTRTPSSLTLRRDTRSRRGITLKEFCELHSDELKEGNKSISKKRLDYIFETIGDLDIKEVLPMHMMEALRHIEENLGNDSIRHYYAFFRKVFQFAITMGFISKSPMEHIPTPKRSRIKRTTKLTEAQRKTLLVLIEASPYRAMLQLMAIVGIPFSIVRCLTWDDLDCGRDILHIRYKVYRFESDPGRRQFLPQTKQRAVHLSPFLMKSLMVEYGKQLAILGQDSLRLGSARLIFRHESGSMMKNEMIRYEVERIGNALGIADLCIKDLYDEAIYLAALMDIPLVDIMGYFNTGVGNKKLADMYMELRSQRAIATIEANNEESVWNN